MKTSQLMLYREIITVCSQIHTKHINTLCVRACARACVCVCVCEGCRIFNIKAGSIYCTGAVIYAGNIVFYITSYEINAMKYMPTAYTASLYSTYKFLAAYASYNVSS